MKRLILALILLTVTIISTYSISPDEIAAMLPEYGAYVDEDGDVSFNDQYGMEYWIATDYPEEGMLYIQSGWIAAPDVTSAKAYELVNESNRTMFLIRCYYEPLSRSFYADYLMPYNENMDAALLSATVEDFLEECDIFTDYLIGEEAL